ncbi:hypothetical protein BC835DRAFT_155869 [Cytidiella melzeri]|nr:hypothetical protein BC835DRAFT_155869 [Cytidiella melzeri]
MPRASSSGIPNPAASQQTKFRVNPKRSYSERMSETRAEIRRIMKEALRAITQDPSASMRWPSYWKDVVCKYRVVVEGWPHDDVPFRNLSDVPNLQKLEILLRGWQAGEIYFRRLSEAEFTVLSAARAAHIDQGDQGQSRET